jgi:hypothetical protein
MLSNGIFYYAFLKQFYITALSSGPLLINVLSSLPLLINVFVFSAITDQCFCLL